MNLDKLYSNSELACSNPICNGCSILGKNKPLNAFMDHENKDTCDILFLSDSLKYKYGKVISFWPKEIKLIEEVCDVPYETAASVKCASVTEKEMKTDDKHKCRNHLEQTIATIKPKLVFACGNLALNMLTKKSGILKKRGSSIPVEMDGHEFVVVPIFHPFAVIKEPKNLPLFQSDIRNAINLFIKKTVEKKPIEFELLMEVEQVIDLANELENYEGPLAVDTETTGLDFVTDKIMTVGISSDDKNYVIPLEHKDATWDEREFPLVVESLRRILTGPKSQKVMHNSKYDLKFFFKYGIIPTGVWDTKVMYHSIDDLSPKGLMDLVKRFFPDELAMM